MPVDGGEVWADDSGGQGAALVLLHPGWGDSEIWRPVMDRLPAHYRLIRRDSRGYGKSPAPVSSYTQLGVAVLEHCDVPRAVVVGHSGGAGTAIGLALAQPRRVSALILLGPGVQDYPWPRDDPYAKKFDTLFAAGDRAGLTALGLRTWAAAGVDPAVQAQVRGAVDAFFREGDFERPDPPVYEQLGQLRVPVVVAIGDLEYPMVRRCSEQIAARIPGSRQLSMPGGDHLLPLRSPDVIAGLIAEYMP